MVQCIPQTGKVSFADRQVDPTTGAMTFEAAFPNPNKLLRPGQYVKIGLLRMFAMMLWLFRNVPLSKCREFIKYMFWEIAVKCICKLLNQDHLTKMVM